MELTSDLIAIQGLLKSLEKSTGDFRRILYKSGNENKIYLIIKEIKDFLSTKKYILDSKINPKYHEEIEKIVLFLTLNSQFENDCDMKDYVHLIGICPLLSKCILLNIILDLDLVEAYCNVMRRFPLIHFNDLVSEIIPAIKRQQPQAILQNTFIFLNYFQSLLATNDKCDIQDVYEIIIDVSSGLLQMTTSINSEHLTNMKKRELYKHIGLTLIHLLDLLYCLDDRLEFTDKFVQIIIESACTILKSVTINVFCAWAEVKYNNQILQMVIREKAYVFNEKYMKLDSVKDLREMLISIAKRPKTIDEMIQGADSSTMIGNVYKNDANQKLWFNALLKTEIFNHKKSINCVNEWSHLCDLSNVDRILNMAASVKTENARKLALKCTSNLEAADVVTACTRYFFKHGIHNGLHNDISSEMTELLNRSGNSDTMDFLKETLLLYLQNPHQVIDILLLESLKSTALLLFLKEIFLVTKDLLQIDHFLSNALSKLLSNYVLSNENIANYAALFDVLLETECITWKKFMDPYLITYLEEHNTDLDNLLLYFTLLNEISNNNEIGSCKNLSIFLNKTFQILDNARFTFFNFTSQKCALVNMISQFLIKTKGKVNKSNLITHEIENYIDRYYLHLYNQQEEIEMFDYFFPNINLNDEADATTKILQVLPSCVEHEWNSIFRNMSSHNDNTSVLQFLTNVITLLAQVAKTQKESDNVLSAMKYYLVCFSSVVQNILIFHGLEDQLNLCTQVSRIIRELPDSISEETSLKLIPLMPPTALVKLGDNKSFASILLSIKNKNVSQLIAKKIVECRNLYK